MQRDKFINKGLRGESLSAPVFEDVKFMDDVYSIVARTINNKNFTSVMARAYATIWQMLREESKYVNRTWFFENISGESAVDHTFLFYDIQNLLRRTYSVDGEGRDALIEAAVSQSYGIALGGMDAVVIYHNAIKSGGSLEVANEYFAKDCTWNGATMRSLARLLDDALRNDTARASGYDTDFDTFFDMAKKCDENVLALLNICKAPNIAYIADKHTLSAVEPYRHNVYHAIALRSFGFFNGGVVSTKDSTSYRACKQLSEALIKFTMDMDKKRRTDIIQLIAYPERIIGIKNFHMYLADMNFEQYVSILLIIIATSAQAKDEEFNFCKIKSDAVRLYAPEFKGTK